MKVIFALLPDDLVSPHEVAWEVEWEDGYGPLPQLGEAVIFDGSKEGETKSFIVSSIGHDLRTGTKMYHREVIIGLLSPDAARGVLKESREVPPL